jgi:hypothetical protein
MRSTTVTARPTLTELDYALAVALAGVLGIEAWRVIPGWQHELVAGLFPIRMPQIKNNTQK